MPFPRIAPRHLALATASAVISLGALAQTGNGQPAKILVGFAAGGTFDVATRLLADKLKEPLGRTVIVESRPGAGGRIAVDALKTAPADGSTAMLCPDVLSTIYPLVFKKLNYDPDSDIHPVSTIAEFPMAFAISASSPVRSFEQYVQWARSHPRDANFGHGAQGGPTYFLGLMLGKDIGVPLQDVPYQGAAPMVTSLVGDQISAGTAVLGDFVEYHKAGKVRILAVTGRQRSALVPDVPTFMEMGYKDLTGTAILSICLPSKTPPAVTAQWSAAIGKALSDEHLKERFTSLSFSAVGSTAAEALQKQRELKAFWEPTIKASGFKAD